LTDPKLLEQEVIQLSLFDEKNIMEVESEEYVGERLIVCRNPLLAEVRRGERKSLIEAAEKELAKIELATKREKRKLTGKVAIAIKVGQWVKKYKGNKYFTWEIEENSFVYSKNEEKIEEENKLDGLYVIRTSVQASEMSEQAVVKSYKSLSKVEQAFRCCKSIDLKVRPIYHYLEKRVKAHVFVCMLAYYVEWHLRELLAPLLFQDEEKEWQEQENYCMVTASKRSAKALDKARKKRTEDGLPVHSFQTLLADLSTITMNWIQPKDYDENCLFEKITKPTVLQEKVFELLGISLVCTQTQ
jgi:transposase